MRTEEIMEETQDELVPFARVVEELGWPAYKVRLAMGKAGKDLRKAKATRRSRANLYPLAHTVRLLREEAQAESDPSEVESEERVPFEQIVRELGSSPNTVRRYLRSARRTVVVFSDPRDNRKKLYPLAHTLKMLRREETRIQARRDRSRDQGAGYWLAVAELKVAAAHLQETSSSLAVAARRVSAAHGALRKNPPTAALEILTLPDSELALVQPLGVLVSPLRLTYWKAVAPDIALLRGEGASPEEAVADLRLKLAASYRQLQQEPDANPQLWGLLNEIIQVRRRRSTGRPEEGHVGT
jgi:hypothetical protein